ncbi:tetratricopeptide repeat protein 21B-like [Paramacrobiotus metropolitanus]|uniref:tetratricopeptide repeat protein 21B-like n=1 Tax=Paramacrobiotus metropolitanus TaxID=2943436 RepID=UPI0024465068|nr:tetratricopeptide repeat protein 21B-like [Paramacrobiotus metropolitanus]
MNHLPENFFVNVDFFLSNQVFEQARKFIRSIPNYSKQDAAYTFFLGVVNMLEGNSQESLRDFSELLEHAVFALPALTGQMCIYSQQDEKDRMAVQKLRQTIEQTKTSAIDEAHFLSGWIFYHNGSYSEALASVQQSIAVNAGYGRAYSLMAMLEMQQHGPTDRVKTNLQKSITANPKEALQAKLLLIHWHILQNDLATAAAEFRDIVSSNEKAAPVRIMNLTLLIVQNNWEAVATAADKLVSVDQQLFLPHIYWCLCNICSRRPAVWKEFEASAITVLERLQKFEPKNPGLWAKVCRLLTRMNNGSGAVLERASTLLRQALSTFTGNATLLLELGDHLLTAGRSEDARGMFERALNRPAFGFRAMLGLVKCDLMQGKHEKAQSDLQRAAQLFISDTEPRELVPYLPLRSSELDYLHVKLDLVKQNYGIESTPETSKTTGTKLLRILSRSTSFMQTNKPLDLDYFVMVDPYFTTRLIRDALQYCQSEPQKLIANSPLLNHCEQVLTSLLGVAPGFTDCAVLLAHVQYLKSDFTKAAYTVENVLESELYGRDAEALLVAAEVYAAQNQTAKCRTALERALANNFRLKDNLRYIVLHNQQLAASGNSAEAIANLTVSLNKPGVSKYTPDTDYTLSDRCSVFLALIQLCITTSQYTAAQDTLEVAFGVFKGTSQYPRLILAKADVLLAIDSRSKAVISLLNSVGPEMEDSYYRTQEKLAGYYLANGMPNEYAELYENLHAAMKDKIAAAVMLGEAYLRVPQPTKALQVIQSAMKLDPDNPVLEATMGQFYTKTHLFANAVNYYEAAVKKGNRTVRLDFARLLLKLKRLERAELLLQEIIASETPGFADAMQQMVAFMLLGKTYKAMGLTDKTIATLKEGKEKLEKIFLRARRENPDAIPEISASLTEVLQLLCDLYCNQGDHQSAVDILQQSRSLLREEDKLTVTKTLARVLLLNNDASEAFRYAKEIQKMNPTEPLTIRLMAEVAFRRKDFDMAVAYYKEYLKKYPQDLKTVAEMAPVLMRLGQVNVLQSFLEENEKMRSQSEFKVLFNLCDGLRARYCGQTQRAVELIMPAVELTDIAAYGARNLIEVICNWDLELPGSQHLPSTSASATDLVNVCNVIGQKAKLLIGSNDYMICEYLPILYRGDRAQVAELLGKIEKWETEKVIPPMNAYILATVLLLLNEKPRALELLRRHERMPWSFQDAEYLERLWLLLAEQLDLSNRGDDVSQLMFRCIEYNRTGYLVNMYDGFHCGNQNHPKAAECFRRAFETTGCTDFVSGERMALAQLSSHRPMDAVDTVDQLSRLPADSNGNMARSIVQMRQIALNQLAFRKDERDMKADAAGRRMSRT